MEFPSYARLSCECLIINLDLYPYDKVDPVPDLPLRHIVLHAVMWATSPLLGFLTTTRVRIFLPFRKHSHSHPSTFDTFSAKLWGRGALFSLWFNLMRNCYNEGHGNHAVAGGDPYGKPTVPYATHHGRGVHCGRARGQILTVPSPTTSTRSFLNCPQTDKPDKVLDKGCNKANNTFLTSAISQGSHCKCSWTVRRTAAPHRTW